MTITLITGANKGLGRETGRRLLEIGHIVLIGARDAERGQRTADELGSVFLEINPTSDAPKVRRPAAMRQRSSRQHPSHSSHGTQQNHHTPQSPNPLGLSHQSLRHGAAHLQITRRPKVYV